MNDATAVTAGVAATATLAAWVAGDDPASTSDRARTWAKHTLLWSRPRAPMANPCSRWR